MRFVCTVATLPGSPEDLAEGKFQRPTRCSPPRWPAIREALRGTGVRPNPLTFYGGNSEAQKRCDRNARLNPTFPCRLRGGGGRGSERGSHSRGRAVYGSVLSQSEHPGGEG